MERTVTEKDIIDFNDAMSFNFYIFRYNNFENKSDVNDRKKLEALGFGKIQLLLNLFGKVE